MRFRFRLLGVAFVLLFCAMLSGGVWLWASPPSFLSFGGSGSKAALAQKEQAEALARARTAMGGELSTFDQMMLHKSRPALDNGTVVKLVNAHVDTAVILQLIHTSNADYDLSANAIIEMKHAGLNEAILLAMINASYGIR